MFSWQSAIDRHPRSGRQRIHEFARKGNWKWVRSPRCPQTAADHAELAMRCLATQVAQCGNWFSKLRSGFRKTIAAPDGLI